MTTKWRFVEKPTGVSTHQVDSTPQRWGFAEYLTWRTGERHLVVHRLDKETSGAMVFALAPESAAFLADAFAERLAKKTYYFVTDRKTQTKDVTLRSWIERRGSQYVSETRETTNAETHFIEERSIGEFTLWRAQPLTGKPHQIRLHAQSLGIPILGDSAHGGSSFPRLMLHAERLELAGECYTSPLPVLFKRLELLNDPQLCGWITGIERRLLLFGTDGQCRRWLHSDGGLLRADALGANVFFYWFSPHSPEPDVLERIRKLAEIFSIDTWYLRWMQNRGGGVQELPLWKSHPEAPESWLANENDLVFEMRAKTLSPGLFLDQRSNRAWVQKSARGKRVLNLFCYTGGFSVAAAKGGASHVTSVDLSANFLRWLNKNFELNDLKPGETHAQDSRKFLDIAHKKQRQFDLIICDPPSFSRGAEGLFRIEKDLTGLLEKMNRVLAPGGEILFCTNYEKWTQEDFEGIVARFARDHKLRVQPAEPTDWDYELPGTEPVMKSLGLKKLPLK